MSRIAKFIETECKTVVVEQREEKMGSCHLMDIE